MYLLGACDYDVRLSVWLFVVLKRIPVVHWPDWHSSAGGHEQQEHCWPTQASAQHTDGGGGLSCQLLGTYLTL